MGEVTEMIREFHGNAVLKGFYIAPESILLDTKNDEDRKNIKDAFIAQRLALIMSELGEALEANRKDHYYAENNDRWTMDIVEENPEAFKNWFEARVKNKFEDELSDAVIRIFDLAGWLNIDLEKHITLKHRYNTGRPFMHNKNY